MNSIENYPIYKKEAVFDMSKNFPQVIKLILLFMGFLDIVFGSLILLVFLSKGSLTIQIILVVLMSWFGGSSCLITMQSSPKKLNSLLILGSLLGITFGVFYLYAIAMSLHL